MSKKMIELVVIKEGQSVRDVQMALLKTRPLEQGINFRSIRGFGDGLDSVALNIAGMSRFDVTHQSADPGLLILREKDLPAFYQAAKLARYQRGLIGINVARDNVPVVSVDYDALTKVTKTLIDREKFKALRPDLFAEPKQPTSVAERMLSGDLHLLPPEDRFDIFTRYTPRGPQQG